MGPDPFLNIFGSLWDWSAGVTLEWLLGDFSSFCVSVALGARPLHNFGRFAHALMPPHMFRTQILHRFSQTHGKSLRYACVQDRAWPPPENLMCKVIPESTSPKGGFCERGDS